MEGRSGHGWEMGTFLFFSLENQKRPHFPKRGLEPSGFGAPGQTRDPTEWHAPSRKSLKRTKMIPEAPPRPPVAGRAVL